MSIAAIYTLGIKALDLSLIKKVLVVPTSKIVVVQILECFTVVSFQTFVFLVQGDGDEVANVNQHHVFNDDRVV
jgi:hypothetical protein